MKKSVFIKNNRQYTTTLTSVKEVDCGANQTKKVATTFAFQTLQRSKDTGSVIHTGFTEVSVEDYDLLLASNKFFAQYIKSGAFQMFDTAPAEALLDSQLVEKLQNENARLTKRVEELEGLLAARVGGAVESESPAPKKAAKKEEVTL